MNVMQMFYPSGVNPQQLPTKLVDREHQLSFEQILNSMSSSNDENKVELFEKLNLMKLTPDQEQLITMPLASMYFGGVSSENELLENEETNKKTTNIENSDIKKDLIDMEQLKTVIPIDDLLTILPIQIRTELKQIATDIQSALTMLLDDENVNEAANKIFTLLERWSELNGMTTQENRMHLQLDELQDARMRALWEKLLTAYERRTSLHEGGRYNTDSKVNQKDVFRWLQHILKDDTTINASNKWNSQVSHTNISAPMSQIEQYVIHIQRNEQTLASPSVDQQLMEKFNHAIRSSRFLSMNNGINQMMFHLKPDNLGEMMVRLVEINGEMTAKIIVTSEVTKRLLQSNIHQLKNMFAPHQVLIEKQEELPMQQTQEEQSELHDQHENGEQSFNKDSNHRQEDNPNDGESFHEILNEKV